MARSTTGTSDKRQPSRGSAESERPWQVDRYWARPVEDLLAQFGSSISGLSVVEARQRQEEVGPNRLRARPPLQPWMLLLSQFKSPLVLILVLAAILSAITGGWVDVAILLLIIATSGALSFMQEYHAGRAVEALRQRVRPEVFVVRDGKVSVSQVEDLVPGDLVQLSAGSLIPADGLLLEAEDLFVNQAVLTGETFPVEKHPGKVEAEASLAQRTNCLFTGSSVRTGRGRMLVCQTGMRTEFGTIAARLTLRPPETAFEQGITRFGLLLTRVMGLLMFLVFAANVLTNKAPLDSLLFAVALAVGIAPELLPAIISVTLSRGAQRMAEQGVIVKRLSAIENFGSMDVLCTDKTGTLTAGIVQLDGAVDPHGQPSAAVLRAAAINAALQTGLHNPLDEAILAAQAVDLTGVEKIRELPYDFVRKRLSVLVEEEGQRTLFTKGAFEQVLAVCREISWQAGQWEPLEAHHLESMQQRFYDWSDEGYRVLGVASRSWAPEEDGSHIEEAEMRFLGFLLFFDPPKPEVSRTVTEMRDLGIELKVITGDNHRVALHVAHEVGLEVKGLLTGQQLRQLHDEALWQLAEQTTIFAEVDPNQKERIISALRRTGHVVGYLGDGINDAPALHLADVGVSVHNAVDVAREAADFVLLEQSLDVLRQGIEEGRRVFANTLKYVFTTTSANFGNMVSMAGLSFFLPFLPLLPTQILLNNFLSDIPAMAIASDEVDRELIDRPRRWDVRQIRNFMLVFGLISSLFDFLTFGLLLLVWRVSPEEFRTAWFLESLFTELLILFVVRTRRPLLRSRPGRYLWIATLLVATGSVLLPWLPYLARWFNFVPLPGFLMGQLLVITLLYVACSEVAKRTITRWHWGG
jgi:Mg2+-importing ATPase